MEAWKVCSGDQICQMRWPWPLNTVSLRPHFIALSLIKVNHHFCSQSYWVVSITLISQYFDFLALARLVAKWGAKQKFLSHGASVISHFSHFNCLDSVQTNGLPSRPRCGPNCGTDFAVCLRLGLSDLHSRYLFFSIYSAVLQGLLVPTFPASETSTLAPFCLPFIEASKFSLVTRTQLGRMDIWHSTHTNIYDDTQKH